MQGVLITSVDRWDLEVRKLLIYVGQQKAQKMGKEILPFDVDVFLKQGAVIFSGR